MGDGGKVQKCLWASTRVVTSSLTTFMFVFLICGLTKEKQSKAYTV